MNMHQTMSATAHGGKPVSLKNSETKTLNLALQGGGAHGAFTWGVLDRLLEEPQLDFEGVVATSAGAMNAAVMAYGLVAGGREGAQKALTNFWRRVSHAVMSPYQFNPFELNPLKQVLQQSIDFETLRLANCKLKLNICATNVRSGKVKVFSNDEITCEAVMASACLPFLFRAVEIGEEAYWDGGYMGNPAIFPIIYDCDSPDVLVVHINPISGPDLPRTATEIMNRINEISFNSSLMREMRAIDYVTTLIDSGAVNGLNLKRMLIHAISADDIMLKLGVASKLNADWEFLTELRDAGRARATAWLTDNYDRIGKASTVDISKDYL
jgi:NTE family protein